MAENETPLEGRFCTRCADFDTPVESEPCCSCMHSNWTPKSTGSFDAAALDATHKALEKPKDGRPIEDILREIAAEVPAEEWARLPDDLSDNLDHYLYGTEKKDGRRWTDKDLEAAYREGCLDGWDEFRGWNQAWEVSATKAKIDAARKDTP